MNLNVVSANAFMAMQNLNIADLAQCTLNEIRPLLPSLVRMSLLSPLDITKSGVEIRKQILSLLVGIECVNNIVSFLQVDYHELEGDVKKEQQLRQKIGNSNQDSAQFHGLQNGVALGFERADVTRKVRIVLSELFYIQSQIIEQNQLTAAGGVGGAGAGGAGASTSTTTAATGSRTTNTENVIKQSELFDNEIYLEEITDIICIALAELPSLFNIQEVVETLLYVNNGSTIICWVVANMPDCFKDVVTSLISNGDEDTAEGKLRLNVLNCLCDMNPGQALSTRTLCVELCKMPSLMLRLSLKDPFDLIAFVSGLLLGNDQNTRSWFAIFVRSSQKRKADALQAVRDELLKQLQHLVVFALNNQLPDECVVRAAAILRLYCALRGIGGIKFNDDEIHLLVQLVTSKPPPTPAGIRFVSLGLCMLIACPTLIAQPALEAKGIEWVQWLIKEEAYFESNSGVAASFGEMLLLMAIHFHSNQVAAIGELVCATLGMKIQLRQNNTTRMKQIFTQEIFTEQVVTAHAVKVPVTVGLNANIPGYLPVHCIHQLLKSRAFTKHKVPIKSWIYRQICNCRTPLHPVLPALIEVYVMAVIAPTMKGAQEHTHRPLSEVEILRVFKMSDIGMHLDGTKKIYSFEYDVKTPDGSGGEVNDDDGGGADEQPIGSAGITSQLLLLYYLLLYEDVRLSNMVNILANGRKVKSYSTEFLSDLPIKYLLQQAQKNQHDFSGIFSPLLRLLVTHFPHLSLVDDWIEDEVISSKPMQSYPIQTMHIIGAFEEIETCPSKTIKLMRRMLKMPPIDLWPMAETFCHYFQKILEPTAPRLIQELYRQVWIRLNTVLPRHLWVLSINALMPIDAIVKRTILTQESVLTDPLHALRCDERIFRCPDVLQIVLRILQASLAASKCQLARHILDKPLLDKSGQLQTDAEREELKTALVASQESVAVQILLEACIETEEDHRSIVGAGGSQWALREIRGIICSYIHQVFISEPSLARLVHFQGYSRDLLAMTVRGIPSMHICLDFIPELLSMPEIDKQVFAIDLTSHLALQYALPKSLSISKLCINTLSTLLGVLASDSRVEMFTAILPCIVRFAEAFPPLLEDCTLFLMQLGRIAEAQVALGRPPTNTMPAATAAAAPLALTATQRRTLAKQTQYADRLAIEVKHTFAKLLDEAVLKPKLY